MRTFLTPTAAAAVLLALAAGRFPQPSTAAATAAAAAIMPSSAAHSGILVHDGFVDANNRAALLCRAQHQSIGEPQDCRKQLAVPGWFSNLLLPKVAGGQEAPPAALQAADAEVLLPLYEDRGDHHEHQDLHVSGPNAGELADVQVGVVYLEGDGDFVLTDVATRAEHRVPIEPGKLISWPNLQFTHRVEGASPCLRRRMLGPMTFDAASNGLVGVGCATVCFSGGGYECLDAPTQTSPSPTPNQADCQQYCSTLPTPPKPYSSFNSAGGACECFTTACTLFTTAPTFQYGAGPGSQCPPLVLATSSPTAVTNSPTAGPTTAPTSTPTLTPTRSPTAVPTDRIRIAASAYHAGKTRVRRGALYALRVTLTLPAANRGRLLLEADEAGEAGEAGEGRELLGWGKPLNTTDYALLVTVPAGGASQVAYKSTGVRPALKPSSLKTPAVQPNGDLLWARVPMSLYQKKDYTRIFKVVFQVSAAATSPLVLGASVWKAGVKLYDAAPVTVTVVNK